MLTENIHRERTMATTQTTAGLTGKKSRKPVIKQSSKAPKNIVDADGDAAAMENDGYARLHRILKIISLIQGQKGWNTKTLAIECSVNDRTIYRDLNMLEGAGIPYFYDPKNRCY